MDTIEEVKVLNDALKTVGHDELSIEQAAFLIGFIGKKVRDGEFGLISDGSADINID